jgi:glyoxylase-like metal-dependent hydrolase (beta-lactamase superfamily II)
MKIIQISKHIWKCSVWVLIPVSVWIVKSEEGLILVDAGIPWMAGGLLKQMQQMDTPLQKILLTHGHSDHVGSIKHILKKQAVPVYAHEVEIPFMEGKLPYPRRSKAETNVEPGLVQPLDTLSALSNDLQPVGGLTPYHTPGHSPGHVVYYHAEDGVLLAGDLFTAKNGKLKRPMAMFTGDMHQAMESAAIVEQLRPKLLSVCHGGDVALPHEQYEAYRLA